MGTADRVRGGQGSEVEKRERERKNRKMKWRDIRDRPGTETEEVRYRK